MRKIIDWNENWQFTTEEDIENAAWEDISLPHTWNAYDGEKVRFVIRDAAGKVAASGNAVSRGGKAQAAMLVNDPLLWDGVDAPNLYTCSAAMDGDEISTAFWL